jgi:hypothetical protein
MPDLTRRRDPDAREECWLIYYDDVHAGTIGIRSGVPVDQDQWGWQCGFYPISPGRLRWWYRTNGGPWHQPGRAWPTRAERRIDVVEFVTICWAIGADPAKILKALTKTIGGSSA